VEAGRRLGEAAAFTKGDPAPLVAAGEALVARAERRAAAAAASTLPPGLKLEIFLFESELDIVTGDLAPLAAFMEAMIACAGGHAGAATASTYYPECSFLE